MPVPECAEGWLACFPEQPCLRHVKYWEAMSQVKNPQPPQQQPEGKGPNRQAEWMKLPDNSTYPHFKELHLRNDWCARAGCRPATEQEIKEGTIMFNVPETKDAKCFEKATRRGQLTFTVVQQDKSGAKVICEWIKQNIETCPAAKLREALEAAIQYRDFPNRKHAD